MLAAFPPGWHHDSLILNKALGFCLLNAGVGRTLETRYLIWAQSTWEYIGCRYSFATETRFRNFNFAKLFGKVANNHMKTREFVFATSVQKTIRRMIDGRNDEALSPTHGERMMCKLIITRVQEATMHFFGISTPQLQIGELLEFRISLFINHIC